MVMFGSQPCAQRKSEQAKIIENAHQTRERKEIQVQTKEDKLLATWEKWSQLFSTTFQETQKTDVPT